MASLQLGKFDLNEILRLAKEFWHGRICDNNLSVIDKKRVDFEDILDKSLKLPRFGMEFAMPGRCSVFEFYGKGPFENYCDRNTAAVVGHYVQRVEDQYHWGYVRPQESGTKTGLRWMKVTDDDGSGMLITSDMRFSASALPLGRRQIDMSIREFGQGDGLRHRHSLELKKNACEGMRSLGRTYVNFDLVQMGLGCVNSWGQWPRVEYLISAQPMQFRFVIQPVF